VQTVLGLAERVQTVLGLAEAAQDALQLIEAKQIAPAFQLDLAAKVQAGFMPK
jgi:hypothetical protein